MRLILTGFVFVLTCAAGAVAKPSWALPPTEFALQLPQPLPGCFEAADTTLLRQRIDEVLTRSGALVPGTDTSRSISFSLDSLDGACRLQATLTSQGAPVHAMRILLDGEPLVRSFALNQTLDQLSQGWLAAKAARLQILSKPTGVKVVVGDSVLGITPLVLERLKPEPLAYRLEARGWESRHDSVQLWAGVSVKREFELVRSRAWKDSVQHEIAKARKDSLWAIAINNPTNTLSELYRHLFEILPATGGSVAVLPFQELGDLPGGYSPGAMAAEAATRYLFPGKGWRLSDTAAIHAAYGKDGFGIQGNTADSAVGELGKRLGSSVVVTGMVNVKGGQQWVSVRLVSSATGELLAAGMAELESAPLEDSYRGLFGRRTDMTDALWRSALLPGWGQCRLDAHGHAAAVAGTTVLAGAATLWSWLDFAAKDDRLDRYLRHDLSTVRSGEAFGDWRRRAETVRGDRNDAALRSIVLSGVLGAAWLVNVVDAGILGYQRSREIHSRLYPWIPTLRATPTEVRMDWMY